MPENLNVLFLAAEADPFIKVGGLGDVAGALPRSLHGLPPEVRGGTALDIRLVLPLHSAIKPEGLRPLMIFPLSYKGGDLQVQVHETNLGGMTVYFIGGEPIATSGSVYSLDSALDAEKYTFFSLAALELTRHLDWKPNIVHANDWHNGAGRYASHWRERCWASNPIGASTPTPPERRKYISLRPMPSPENIQSHSWQ